MKKTVKDNKPAAGDRSAAKTGRQAPSASSKKAANKSRIKTPAKKPITKKSASKEAAEKSRTNTRPAGKEPVEKKRIDTRPANNDTAAKKRDDPNEKKRDDTRQAVKKPIKRKQENKKSTAKRKLFGRRKPAAKPSSGANSTVQSAAAQQKAAKPVDKRSRKAADRAVRNKQAAAVKKHRYHGGNYILYYILAGLIVITVLVILANTVLFKCKDITVTGNSRYAAEEIISSSGIETGMNLLHISRANTAAKIESELAYVDSVEVKKSFPTGIEISVVEAQRWFGVRQGSITAAVSHGGKIVEHGMFDGLPLVIGMEAENVEVGVRLKSAIEGKNNLPALIMSAVESTSLEKVDEVDISDRFSIKMKLDGGRIILELGTSSEMESKLTVAKAIIDDHIGDAESITIIINNPTTAFVHNNTSENEPVTSDTSNSVIGSDEPNGQSNSNDS